MSSSQNDRNLLYGVLALQMDFISRDALITAMNAWVVAKHKSLDELLLEQDLLDNECHQLLAALVDKHLALHGNDAEKSLAAVDSVGSVLDELKRFTDADIQASLKHLSVAGQPDDDSWCTKGASIGSVTSSGLRFRILRPHAKGGLGQVSVAYDVELSREVALKEIQIRHADHAESRNRFALEAEVTGRLEHPGIVPVYGLGQYADGRPFYAMRFIRGDDLRGAIERFHAGDTPERDPGERTLALCTLLRRFIDVCNAIAYAHSRGILHRDLKPGNVMLGQYGETLVVDWGLAKQMEQTAVADETGGDLLWPTAGKTSAPTQMGRAVGTPQFMSPEQAAGRLDQLGPASDVYSLGATMYCLLTGKSAFEDNDIGEVLRKVQKGDFPPPRQLKKQVPAALEAICRKAMALKPQSRYQSPQALADDVEHWLADEPIEAYPEPLGMRLKRWARRHRTLTSSAAVLLATAVVASGIGWVATERLRHYAVEQHRLAEVRFDFALQAVDQMLTRVGHNNLAQVPQMTQVRRELLTDAKRFCVELLSAKPTDVNGQLALGRVRLLLGSIEEDLDPEDKNVETHYRAAISILEPLLKHGAHPDKNQLSGRCLVIKAYNWLGDHLQLHTNRAGEAESNYELALELARNSQSADNPEIRLERVRTYYNRGTYLENHGRRTEALEDYDKAVEEGHELEAGHPSAESRHHMARAYVNRGKLHHSLKNPNGARADLASAIALYVKLLNDPHRQYPNVLDYKFELAKAYLNLGNVLSDGAEAQQLATAKDNNEKARSLFDELAQAYPNVADYRAELAKSYNNLGNVTSRLADLAEEIQAGQLRREAEKMWRGAQDRLQPLVVEFPLVLEYRKTLGTVSSNLGLVAMKLGEFKAACQQFGAAVEHGRKALNIDRNNYDVQDYLCEDLLYYASMLLRQGDRGQAVEQFNRAIVVSSDGRIVEKVESNSVLAPLRQLDEYKGLGSPGKQVNE